jgi:hypothetical protein
MLPKQIEIAIKVVVKKRGFLVSPLRKFKILGSMSSSATALMS